MKGDRSHPEEVMKVLEDFNKKQQEDYAKTKKQPQAKDTPPPTPVPSDSYGYLLWIPFAGLVWWLYRRVCKASQN